jgi:CO/xanthine dehydrogenase FAD-binding subunit
MLKEDIIWYRPDSYEKALSIHMNEQDTVPCAGSTALLRIKSKKIKGFIDLSKCELSYIEKRKNNEANQVSICIGSMATFNEVIEFLQKDNPASGTFEYMLMKALIEAASYPLRNLITIGGSLYDFPLWSDLYAPLFCANVKIDCHNKVFDLAEYVKIRRSIPHIIEKITIDYDKNKKYGSERFSQTTFDYAALRVAIAARYTNDSSLDSFICAITGTKNLYYLDEKFNNSFVGKNLQDEKEFDDILNNSYFGFGNDFRFSQQYKEKMARVLIKDIIMRGKNSIN